MFKYLVLVIAALISVSTALAGELIIQGNSSFLQNGANRLFLSGDLTVGSTGIYTGDNQSFLEITDNISISGSGSIVVGSLVLLDKKLTLNDNLTVTNNISIDTGNWITLNRATGAALTRPFPGDNVSYPIGYTLNKPIFITSDNITDISVKIDNATDNFTISSNRDNTIAVVFDNSTGTGLDITLNLTTTAQVLDLDANYWNPCSFGGNSITHGGTVTAYLAATVPFGQTCTSQTRTCNAGTLSGTYSYASCSVLAAPNCTFNGQTVSHGGSVVAYLTATVPFGQTCSSETRVCTLGTLSGSYTFASCSPLAETVAETTPAAPAETTPAAPVETTPAAPAETTPAAPAETTPAAPAETTPAAPAVTPVAVAPPPVEVPLLAENAPVAEVGVTVSSGEAVKLSGGTTGAVVANEDGTKAVVVVSADGNQIQANAPANAITEASETGGLVVKVATASGATAEQEITSEGVKAAFKSVTGETTGFTAPKAVGTNDEPDAIKVVVEVKMNEDGSMESLASFGDGESAVAQQLKVSDAGLEATVSAGGVKASVVSPPGTAAVPTATGGVTITPPPYVPPSGGPPLQITIPINSSGKTSPKLPSVEGIAPVVLPSVSGDVAVVTGDDGVPQVEVTTSELTPPTANSSGRSSNASETESFIGRTIAGKEVLIYNQSSDAKFRFSRKLTEASTEFTLLEGSARIKQGSADTDLLPSSPVEIKNDAVQLDLIPGGNYVTPPIQSSRTAADLEVDFAQVHSVWTYSNAAGSWQAYSVDSNVQAALRADEDVSSLSTPATIDGMFVYSKDNASSEVLLADGRDLSIKNDIPSLKEGWHLLTAGNQGEAVGDLASLNSNLETIWIKDGGGWKVYTTSTSLANEINQAADLTLLSSIEALPKTGSSIWVNIKSSSGERSGRLATPPSY